MLTASPAETQALGRLLGEALAGPTLILLAGELGAGKTCFVQGLARGLGVPAQEPVTSPTFALMNQYRGRLPLNHFDLYRLSSTDELLDLGFEEFMPGSGVAVVEWPERLPRDETEALRIRFDVAGEEVRALDFAASGKLHEALLGNLCRCWRERGRA